MASVVGVLLAVLMAQFEDRTLICDVPVSEIVETPQSLLSSPTKRKEAIVAIVAHVVLRGVSREQYDAVRAETGWLERPPTGGISHVTWWEGDDCHNIDAWESEAAFNTFGTDRLGPAMAKLGINTPPEVTFHPAHEVFTPKAVTLTQ